jgi:hypothetical protein
MSSSRSDRRELKRIFEDCIQVFNTPYRYYRIAAHRFLAYLEANFPQLNRLSELRRDPHLLGWFHSLCDEDPPLSTHTRRIYLTALRRLLKDLAGEGHALESGLILSEDFPPRPPHFPRWARNKGISNVRVEVIGVPKQFVPDLFAVQVGAFQDRGNAERYLALMQSQYGSGRITVREGDPTLWRVLVGSEKTLERAIALASRIRQESAERTAFVARLDR